jgi:hypothetical protein
MGSSGCRRHTTTAVCIPFSEAFFSSFGAVSKAWLQRQRADNGSGHVRCSGPVLFPEVIGKDGQVILIGNHLLIAANSVTVRNCAVTVIS